MKYFKLIFWGIIATSIILPLVIFFPLALDSFIHLPEERFGTIISFFILLPLLNGFPFFILARYAKIHLNISKVKISDAIFYQRMSGVIGAVVTTFGISLYINLVVAISRSSTAPIALFFLPLYGIVAIPIGYFCGRLIGSLILKIIKTRPVQKSDLFKN